MVDTSLKYFTQVLSVISEFNIPKDDCLRAVGLSEFPKSERVDAYALAQIFNFAANRLDDPQIGIKCALKYPIMQYTRPAEFLKLCRDLKHAADIYNGYSPLFHRVGSPSAIQSNDGIDRMLWTPNFDQGLTEDYRQFIEFSITNLMTSVNWLAWKTPQAVRLVNFKHEAIGPARLYSDLLGCDVKFAQEDYSLILQDGVKDAPFAMSDPAELAKACIRFDVALNELFEAESLINRIELQIRRALDHTMPTKTSIAESLGLSERSMARALKDKGTSFKEIKLRVFQNLAIAKIEEGRPLIEIAHHLGYNDQSAFSRAFKNWFGYPPGQHNTKVK